MPYVPTVSVIGHHPEYDNDSATKFLVEMLQEAEYAAQVTAEHLTRALNGVAILSDMDREALVSYAHQARDLTLTLRALVRWVPTP